MKNTTSSNQFQGKTATRKNLSYSVLLLFFLLFSLRLFSQIGYTAVRNTGVSYSSVTSGSSFASWRNGTNTDDNLSQSTAIGFNFYYDGASRTTFSASTNGFITFNTGTTATGNGSGAYGYLNSAFSTSSQTTQSLAPMYFDLQTAGNPATSASLASSIKYRLTGSSPNRILTVEWKSMEVYGSSGPNLNFQIKLYETSNKIEYIYGTMTGSTAAYSYTSGLNSLNISSIPQTYELYCQQVQNTAVFSNTSSNSLTVIPAGSSKVTFTPLPGCSGSPLAGSVYAAATTFCGSGSTTLNLTGYTTGVLGIAFQWQNSTDGGATWNTLPGATSTTFTTPLLTSTTSYRCSVKCTGSGIIVNSSPLTITINTPPAITCPGPITVISSGGCSAPVTYSASVSGSPAPVVTYSITSGSVFSSGTTLVSVTASNACGVSTCSFLVTVVASGDNYWLGSTSDNWFDALNWCAGIPDATSNVTIPAGVTYMPSINSIGAVCKNLTINAGGALSVSPAGTLTLKGDWNNAGLFSSMGNVVFSGSVPQTIEGNTAFYDLEIDNPAGITLGASGSISVFHVAKALNGVITTGSKVMTMDSSATFFKVNGWVNGNLKKHISAGTFSSQIFEVGDGARYAPLEIQFNMVTTKGNLTAYSIATDHPAVATSGLNPSNTVNRHWNILNDGVVFDFYDLGLNYHPADPDPGFVPCYAGLKLYVSGTWQSFSADYGSSNYLSFIGQTSLGGFQIGLFNPIPTALSMTPDYGYKGQTVNLTVSGRGFIPGASTLSPVSGMTVNSINVLNDSTLIANVSISSTALSGNKKICIKNALPSGGTSDSLTFTIRNKPVASFFANRTKIVCNLSGNVEFNNYSTDAVSYLWDFGSGASPASSAGSGAQIVTYSTTGYKTVKLIAFSPVGNDTLIKVNYVNVTSSAPAAATAITGLTNVCGSSISTVVYNTPLIADVVYQWTVPSTATIISGQGTKTLLVSFSSAYSTGSISVKLTNGCGTSAAKSITVSKLPPVPASITGPVNVCGLSAANYTVATTAGALSYTWTLPLGVTSPAGPSPITTTSTTLAVNFSATFSSGTISVAASNACYSSSPRSLAIRKSPSTPGVITGATNVCALTSATYSVAPVSGAVSYIWTLPAGITSSVGISPVTTTTSTLTVDILSTFSTGSISVKASNACGTSTLRSLALSGCHAFSDSIAGDLAPQEKSDFTLYPNPTAGRFSIQYESNSDSKLIFKIHDLKGRVVSTGSFDVVKGDNAFFFPEENLEKSIYLIELTDVINAVHDTKKLIVQ